MILLEALFNEERVDEEGINKIIRMKELDSRMCFWAVNVYFLNLYASLDGENNKVEKVRNMFYKQTNIDVKRQRGFCQKGNGIVRLRDNIAKYYLSTVKNGINRSFKIISEKGFAPSKENNCLYYFEVKIIPEIEEECGWAVEIGLFKDNSQQFRVCSNGLFCSKTCLNSPYKQIPMFGCLIKPMDVVGCGIYFPQLDNNENNSAQLFFTINGKKKGKTIFIELNNDKEPLVFYPNVSLFCCSVEANFGTNKFLYKIGEFKE
uniref:SPRY domain-containing protein n=1 Tax=Meloidogyne javanica TaxID=6303 RepID=A0A915LDC6_MELJA